MPFTGSTTGSLRGGGSSIFSDDTGGTVAGAALGVVDPDPCCIAAGLSRLRSREDVRNQLSIITNQWDSGECCVFIGLIHMKIARKNTA